MRTRNSLTLTGVLAAAALTAVAGCGGAADAEENPKSTTSPSSSASASPSAKPAAPLTQGQAEEALIEVSDLPVGWKVDAAGAEEAEGGEGPALKADKPQCQPLLDGSFGGSGPRAKAEAYAAFTKDADYGPFLLAGVEAFTEKQAEALMEPVEATDGCESFTGSYEGDEVLFRTQELSVPQVGDGEAYGFRFSVEYEDEDGYVWVDQTDTVVARVGGAILQVSQQSDGGNDQEAFDRAVEKLVEKTRKVAAKGAAGAGV
ncbi:hypothetical protein [Streptomyces indicus]|uniref:PknH-like extracellular domain-containing protein n=1 Tax=Streptomyces indicus TaxID=417292 RepID=A0A1G9DC03_9ACTN|nr:hypothetical protein [Streptomyces indicus]SDK61334.1 hypothetical protein SAMN05421806_109135 [Streptomyces indicus]